MNAVVIADAGQETAGAKGQPGTELAGFEIGLLDLGFVVGGERGREAAAEAVVHVATDHQLRFTEAETFLARAGLGAERETGEPVGARRLREGGIAAIENEAEVGIGAGAGRRRGFGRREGSEQQARQQGVVHVSHESPDR